LRDIEIHSSGHESLAFDVLHSGVDASMPLLCRLGNYDDFGPQQAPIPAKDAFKINNHKTPRIEPVIPLARVPQPLAVATGDFSTHEKSSNTTKDGDHLLLERWGSYEPARASFSQSWNKGARASIVRNQYSSPLLSLGVATLTLDPDGFTRTGC